MESEDSMFQPNDECLDDVAEDPESGDSETATEVEVSEKALKFKISTEPNITGRKSYPGSRKGSRERVQNLNSSELAKVMQKGKLRAGALSFDHHCLSTNKKLSFDPPEFLDEYAIILRKKFDVESPSSEEDGYKECVLSKETLNLNKRNSEHSVKLPQNLEEKRSILKTSDSKSFSNIEKLKLNNLKSLPLENQECGDSGNLNKCLTTEGVLKNEENGKPIEACEKKHFSIKSLVKQSSISKSDNLNSISVEKCDLNQVHSDPSSEIVLDNKTNSRSLFSRFKYFTDKFGLSTEKDSKVKTSKPTGVKNNNTTRMTLPLRNKKKLESPCCKSLENVDDRRASTLPKTKKSGTIKKGWKFLILGKEKSPTIEGWASDADVNKQAVSTIETDNHSLPSTSHSQSSCALNISPKAGGDIPRPKVSADQLLTQKQTKQREPSQQVIIGNNVVNKVNKLQEIQADQIIVVSTNENDAMMI